jgi:glycosyltransferase involved in cell wall biosynthesis
MTTPDPLVTVLTPLFNTEEHIAECIESVLAQTYEHWEYVITDNCSSDGGPEIVREFTAREPRIRYLRFDEHVDVIASYNRAFDTVGPESTYTKVVGADDWLYPDCLLHMVDRAERSPSAGIVSAYRMDQEQVDRFGMAPGVVLMQGGPTLKQNLLGGPNVTGSATSIMVRSSFVRRRRPFYDLTFRHADTEAAYWLMTQSDVGFVHELLTFTRRPARGETHVARRLRSYLPEDIRMLLRYGHSVLSEEEYERRLAELLREYVVFQLKRRIKRDTRRDETFWRFHRREIELMRTEGRSDRRVRRAAAISAALLGRSRAGGGR